MSLTTMRENVIRHVEQYLLYCFPTIDHLGCLQLIKMNAVVNIFMSKFSCRSSE